MIAGLYVLATVVNHFGVKDEAGHGFQASPLQTISAVMAVLVLVGAALRWRTRPFTDSPVPAPWLLALVGFVAYLLYLPAEDALAVAVGVTVVAAVIGVVGTWSRSGHWGDWHTIALALGTVMVGLVMPFWADPYDNAVSGSRELIADVVAASACLAIVTLTVWRHRAISSTGPRAGP